METVINYILSIFITIGTIFSLVPTLNNVTYMPEEDNIVLNCAVVSDTHADNNSFRDRTNILRKAYTGIGNSSQRIDVLLNIGDITNSGSVREYFNEKRLRKIYMNPKNTVACLGNHDSWNGSADPDYEEACRLYFDYLESNNIKTDKVYYSTIIEGYYFICLATESLDLHENLPTYSNEQIKWFEDTLNEAVKSNLPIFVLCHKPLSGRNAIENSDVPAEIDRILQSHNDYAHPILFFCGHHHTFNKDDYDSENNVYYFLLPSLEYNDETENEATDNGGMGLTMEVYDSKITINSRNFIKDKNIEGYRIEIPTTISFND